MKTVHLLLAAGLLAASTASVAITIDTVLVGDAGNTGEVQVGGTFGAVSYDYHIGTHEVTNAQYASFLNAAAATDTHNLYNSNMGSNARGGISRIGSPGSFTYSTRANMADKPVNYVSFWDAARFTNWLTSGNTETGVYVLTPAGISNNTITRNTTAWNNGGVAIASENEWYKAAYYSGVNSGDSGDILMPNDDGYWLYPTQSNSAPMVATANTTGDISNPGTNVANYNSGADWNSQDGNVTTVGSAGAASASHYGTFDQGGNVWEWNDEIFITNFRALRGASFFNDDSSLQSSGGGALGPADEDYWVGFRVSSLAPIPEPSAYATILGCVGLGLALMRRKRRSFFN